MAGAWMSVVYGFAGMMVHEDTLSFAPRLPKKWTGYRFKITYRGRLLEVKVAKKGVEYRLLAGEKLTFYHKTKKLALKEGMGVFCPYSDLLAQGISDIRRRYK
jgi:alpha,alpha-trehalose phosphorylase